MTTEKHEAAKNLAAGEQVNKDQVRWWFVGSSFYSTEELRLLRYSFTIVKDHLGSIGTAAFTQLFDEDPDAFKVFAGKKVLPESRLEVNYSWETKQHSLRVFHSIEKCLNRMNNADAYRSFVESLGARHVIYGAHPNHVISLIGCLRGAILKELQVQWPHQNSANKRTDNKAVIEEEEQGVEIQPEISSSLSRCINAWDKFFTALSLGIVSSMIEPESSVNSHNNNDNESQEEANETCGYNHNAHHHGSVHHRMKSEHENASQQHSPQQQQQHQKSGAKDTRRMTTFN